MCPWNGCGPRSNRRTRVPEPIEALWAQYKDSGAEDLRERLILHYSPLVKFVAGRVGFPHGREGVILVADEQ